MSNDQKITEFGEKAKKIVDNAYEELGKLIMSVPKDDIVTKSAFYKEALNLKGELEGYSAYIDETMVE